ncbi:MAG: flavodoxin [Muribaculaceae bacterium]|nr:flavodoxin [Roseburia sp.]MCM1430744.1 flavodoxin [Muribaculaceae bacterium]MCM1492723.1 flavodoxin [Muribaculaceae bacterium]
MKLKNRWIAGFISFILIAGFCIGNMQTVQANAKVKKMSLNYTSVTMPGGAELTLKVTSVSPAGASKKVTWSSSNKKVLTVSKKGVITAKKAGTATITAKAKSGGKKVKCKVKVTEKKKQQSKVLVAYFSATGTTKGVAEKVAKATGGVLYRITPAKEYSSGDLDYNNDNSRANKEQNNKQARPSLKGEVVNIKDFDTVFIAFPIWWGQAPKVICTFLESYDFSGKTIIPFCTSHSSGIGSSDTNLHSLCSKTAEWKAGRRFSSGATQDEINEWLDCLSLEGSSGADSQEVSVFPLSEGANGAAPVITLSSGYEMPVLGLGTYSLLDDVCVDSVSAALENGVRKIDTAYMYHNEAEVGEAIRASGIPREEIFVTTKLYPNQFDEPEKAIDEALEKLDIGYIDLMLLHHPGTNDVKAYKAMEKAVAEGKIRSIGLSNWYIEEMEEFLPQVNIMPALVQNEIHPYYQEKEVVEYMHEKGIVMEAWWQFRGRAIPIISGKISPSLILTDGGGDGANRRT